MLYGQIPSPRATERQQTRRDSRLGNGIRGEPWDRPRPLGPRAAYSGRLAGPAGSTVSESATQSPDDPPTPSRAAVSCRCGPRRGYTRCGPCLPSPAGPALRREFRGLACWRARSDGPLYARGANEFDQHRGEPPGERFGPESRRAGAGPGRPGRRYSRAGEGGSVRLRRKRQRGPRPRRPTCRAGGGPVRAGSGWASGGPG